MAVCHKVIYTRNNAGPSFRAEEWFDGYTAFNYALEDENYALCYFLICQPDIDLNELFADEMLTTATVLGLDGEFDVEMVKQSLLRLIQNRARRRWAEIRHHLVKRRIGFYWMELPARNTTRDRDRQAAELAWSTL